MHHEARGCQPREQKIWNLLFLSSVYVIRLLSDFNARLIFSWFPIIIIIFFQFFIIASKYPIKTYHVRKLYFFCDCYWNFRLFTVEGQWNWSNSIIIQISTYILEFSVLFLFQNVDVNIPTLESWKKSNGSLLYWIQFFKNQRNNETLLKKTIMIWKNSGSEFHGSALFYDARLLKLIFQRMKLFYSKASQIFVSI